MTDTAHHIEAAPHAAHWRPLGSPRVWPYCLPFYGYPHCSPAFISARASDTTDEHRPGRARAQAAWLRARWAA